MIGPRLIARSLISSYIYVKQFSLQSHYTMLKFDKYSSMFMFTCREKQLIQEWTWCMNTIATRVVIPTMFWSMALDIGDWQSSSMILSSSLQLWWVKLIYWNVYMYIYINIFNYNKILSVFLRYESEI